MMSSFSRTASSARRGGPPLGASPLRAANIDGRAARLLAAAERTRALRGPPLGASPLRAANLDGPHPGRDARRGALRRRAVPAARALSRGK
mmetsp:Transcript_16031/g.49597  ORF Transcript_16031/g.49597 Transcript_16031/m.49597 type:complete len:91 (+) Transcript_16031:999-1271(+)